MREFVSFEIYFQSIFLYVKHILKNKINEICVPQLQLAYIYDTTHILHYNLVKFCHDVQYMCRGNQELELQ